MSRRLLSAFSPFSPLLPFAESAFAQIDTGVIVGRVTDDSGAVLPGVTVVATQDGTGVASTTVTNERGEFIFPGLRVGVYAVTAELQGFKRAVHRDIRVNVQTRAQVDLQLNVGALAEEVIVTGRAELLQTQTADIGNVVDARQVPRPAAARTAIFRAGVSLARRRRRAGRHHQPRRGHLLQRQRQLRDLEQLHARRRRQQFVLDQSPGTQPAGRAAAGRCAAEFKVQTRTYSAEFGKAAGAVINASVKQGTNQFSGSLFGFLRDESLNANTWDNIRANRPKGPFNQLIAGGTLGGPIISNKTFFFGDYQSSRTERALSQTATVPTARMRAGDLSELTGSMVATNAFVPAGCVDAANKIISQSCFDPVAAKLIGLFPMPNVPGAGFFNNNFISNGILNNDVDQFDIRIDHNLSARQRSPVRALQLPEHRPA